MYITAQGPRLRNDLYCVEWDVKLYYTIPLPYLGRMLLVIQWNPPSPRARPIGHYMAFLWFSY